MNNRVPEGWKFGLFGDLAKVQNGYAFKSTEFSDTGYAAAIRMSNLKLGRVDLSDAKYVSQESIEGLDQFQLASGDFLFGMSGSLDNYAWVKKTDGICYLNQRVGCLRIKPKADPLYTSYCYLSGAVKDAIVGLAAGAAQLNISGNQLQEISILIPPLPEQQKIATILSSVDDVIEKTRAQIDKLKDLKTGMMQELLTKGIGHTEFKESPVGRIPLEWSIEKLINLSVNGINNGVFNDPKNVGSGYRLINVVNMYRGFGIQIDTLKRLEIDEKEFARNKVEKGDVFFTRSSLKLEGIAYCNINLSDDDDITYDGHLMRVRPDQSRVLPKYLAYYCLSDSARVFFMQGAKHSTMTTIGQADIAPLPVLIPSLDEQKDICNVLDSIRSKISVIESKLASTKQVKKALMQDLLTGKVRVNLTDKESAVV